MATLGQAITVFEEDTLVLRFIFPDLTTNFDTNWGAWIGFAASNFPTSTTIVRSKANAGWTYNSGTPTEVGANVSVVNNSNVIEIFFTQADFSDGSEANTLTGGTDYYFELVVSDNKNEARSVVAATGIFTVNQSLFTENSFRP